MANLIPVETRRREALVRLGGFWAALAVAVIGACVFFLTDSSTRAAKADQRLQQAKRDYNDLQSRIRDTKRLLSRRDQLLRKQEAIETLRRDQRSISALRDLAALSGTAVWFQRVSLTEQTPKRNSSSGKKRFDRPTPAPQPRLRHTLKPVTIMITGFALSQQELAELLSRLSAHERFAGVELRWSSRTAFLEGEAVKFVVWGTYR